MMRNNHAKFSVPVSVFKEGDTFVAYAPTLDISTCAESLAEVHSRFTELVQIFFEELVRLGTTDEVLESLGWHKSESSWNPPMEVEHRLQSFNVPMRACHDLSSSRSIVKTSQFVIRNNLRTLGIDVAQFHEIMKNIR